MNKIYYISGFGADERVFSDIDFGKNESHFIAWKKPFKNESIYDYANRLAAEIKHEKPVLIGLSFGGIMAIEIAKFTSLKKVILISSIKTKHEKPFYMKMAATLHLNSILPLKPYPFLDAIENYQLGVKTEAEKKLVREYRRNLDLDYSNWAIDQILNWQNEWTPENLIHIHADNDRIFPIKNVKPDYVIHGGGHLVLMNRASKVNEILKQELE